MIFSENLNFYLKEKDPDALIGRLIEDAHKPVSEGRFSRQRSSGTFMEYAYGAFTERDLRYIENALGETAKK
jgi:hypothetical protein